MPEFKIIKIGDIRYLQVGNKKIKIVSDLSDEAVIKAFKRKMKKKPKKTKKNKVFKIPKGVDFNKSPEVSGSSNPIQPSNNPYYGTQTTTATMPNPADVAKAQMLQQLNLTPFVPSNPSNLSNLLTGPTALDPTKLLTYGSGKKKRKPRKKKQTKRKVNRTSAPIINVRTVINQPSAIPQMPLIRPQQQNNDALLLSLLKGKQSAPNKGNVRIVSSTGDVKDVAEEELAVIWQNAKDKKKYETQYEQLKDSYRDLEAQTLRLANERAYLQNTINDEQSRQQLLIQQLTDLNQQVSTRTQDHERLEREIDESTKKQQLVEAQLIQVTADFQNARDDIKKKEEALQLAGVGLQEKDKQLEQVTAQKDKILDTFQYPDESLLKKDAKAIKNGVLETDDYLEVYSKYFPDGKETTKRKTFDQISQNEKALKELQIKYLQKKHNLNQPKARELLKQYSDKQETPKTLVKTLINAVTPKKSSTKKIVYKQVASDDDDDDSDGAGPATPPPRRNLFKQTGQGIGDDSGLYNNEIEHLMRKHKQFKGTFAVDQLNEVPVSKNGFSFIMNTSKFPNPGHWVAVLFTTDTVEFFDSFANEPPKTLVKWIKQVTSTFGKKLQFKINRIKFQKSNSNNCGYFAMRFITDRYDGKKFKDITNYSKLEQSLKGEKMIEDFKKKCVQFGYI